MCFCTCHKCMVGKPVAAASEECIVGLWIEGQHFYTDVPCGKEYRFLEAALSTMTKQLLKHEGAGVSKMYLSKKEVTK